ncbi:hypothetical protein ACU6U9_20850 [Pseudomonas sp. HK3]|jgi:hypothetical protein
MLIVRFKRIVLACLLVGLFGCGNDITRLSDDELRQKIHGCDYALDLTVAEHQVCENYHRECKRRLNEGRFVCT